MADKETVVHILWINAGLSCDGDSVALTAAMQPSIEDIVLGTLPGLPKVAVHWPLIAPETGPVGGDDDFIEWFFKGARGEINPFVLVIEGSIPNEKLKKEGYWSGFGNDPATGQPITTSAWIDRLAPKALLVLAVGTCATYRRNSCDVEQSDRRDGGARLSGMGLEIARRNSNRMCARMSNSAGQSFRDHRISLVPGRWTGPDDSSR